MQTCESHVERQPSQSKAFITPIWFEYGEVIKQGFDRNTTRATANHLTTWDGSNFLKPFPWRRQRQRAFRSFEWRNKSAVKDSVNRPKYLQPQSEHSRWHSPVWGSASCTETAEFHWWVCYWKHKLTSHLYIPVWPFKYVSMILCQPPVYLHWNIGLNLSPT